MSFTPSITIYCTDKGKYHETFIWLSFERKDGEENLLIKYGDLQNYMPLTASLVNDKVYLGAAMITKYGEIKVPVYEWIKAIKRLGVRSIILEWQDKINSKLSV